MKMSRQTIRERIEEMKKELVIREGMKIIAMPYAQKEGFFYIVKNERSQFDTSFVGDWEHLKKRMYAFTRGVELEEDFLKLFKETED